MPTYDVELYGNTYKFEGERQPTREEINYHLRTNPEVMKTLPLSEIVAWGTDKANGVDPAKKYIDTRLSPEATEIDRVWADEVDRRGILRSNPDVLKVVPDKTFLGWGTDLKRSVKPNQHYLDIRSNKNATPQERLWADELARRRAMPTAKPIREADTKLNTTLMQDIVDPIVRANEAASRRVSAGGAGLASFLGNFIQNPRRDALPDSQRSFNLALSGVPMFQAADPAGYDRLLKKHPVFAGGMNMVGEFSHDPMNALPFHSAVGALKLAPGAERAIGAALGIGFGAPGVVSGIQGYRNATTGEESGAALVTGGIGALGLGLGALGLKGAKAKRVPPEATPTPTVQGRLALPPAPEGMPLPKEPLALPPAPDGMLSPRELRDVMYVVTEGVGQNTREVVEARARLAAHLAAVDAQRPRQAPSGKKPYTKPYAGILRGHPEVVDKRSSSSVEPTTRRTGVIEGQGVPIDRSNASAGEDITLFDANGNPIRVSRTAVTSPEPIEPADLELTPTGGSTKSRSRRSKKTATTTQDAVTTIVPASEPSAVQRVTRDTPSEVAPTILDSRGNPAVSPTGSPAPVVLDQKGIPVKGNAETTSSASSTSVAVAEPVKGGGTSGQVQGKGQGGKEVAGVPSVELANLHMKLAQLNMDKSRAKSPKAIATIEAKIETVKKQIAATSGAKSSVSTADTAPVAASGHDSATTTIIDKSRTPDGYVEAYPISDIVVNKDVKQFKANADKKTGVDVPLEGSYQRDPLSPIVLWEKLNGETEVITGRHRLDLAKRSGETTIPAQVMKEADGFTADKAHILDAEANIRDSKGSIDDYAVYFRNTKGTYADESAARARGLLDKSVGNAGWHIGRNASDDIWSLYTRQKITAEQAAAIARVGAGKPDLQRVGSRYALKGKPADFIASTMQAAETYTAKGPKQPTMASLFDDGNDAAWQSIEEQAKVAVDIQKELKERLLSARGPAQRPEVAKSMGVDVASPEKTRADITGLRDELARWKDWSKYPDLVKQARGEEVSPYLSQSATPAAEAKPTAEAKPKMSKVEAAKARLSKPGAIGSAGDPQMFVDAAVVAADAAKRALKSATKMTRDLFDSLNIKAELTQRATTIHTRLEQDGVISSEDFAGGKGLVYGDGKGGASKALGAKSYEPFPPEGFKPDYTGDRSRGLGDDINGKFGSVLNTYVLNVVDPDTRGFVVRDTANLLSKGGRAVFVTRGNDVMGSTPVHDFGGMERVVQHGSGLTYQKGFTQPELVGYLKDTLGDGFEVRPVKGGSASEIRAEVVKLTDVDLANPTVGTTKAGVREMLRSASASLDAAAKETMERWANDTSLRSGMTAKDLKDAAIMGMHYLKRGATSFKAWSKAMRQVVDESFTPQLKAVWNYIQNPAKTMKDATVIAQKMAKDLLEKKPAPPKIDKDRIVVIPRSTTDGPGGKIIDVLTRAGKWVTGTSKDEYDEAYKKAVASARVKGRVKSVAQLHGKDVSDTLIADIEEAMRSGPEDTDSWVGMWKGRFEEALKPLSDAAKLKALSHYTSTESSATRDHKNANVMIRWLLNHGDARTKGLSVTRNNGSKVVLTENNLKFVRDSLRELAEKYGVKLTTGRIGNRSTFRDRAWADYYALTARIYTKHMSDSLKKAGLKGLDLTPETDASAGVEANIPYNPPMTLPTLFGGMRLFKAGMDFSAAGRQGKFLVSDLMTDPSTMPRVVKLLTSDQFRAAKSAKAYEEIIKNNGSGLVPMDSTITVAELADLADLKRDNASPSAGPNGKIEMFPEGWPEKLGDTRLGRTAVAGAPLRVVSKAIMASDRSYVAVIDTLRMTAFEKYLKLMAEAGMKPTENMAMVKEYARNINLLSRHGKWIDSTMGKSVRKVYSVDAFGANYRLSGPELVYRSFISGVKSIITVMNKNPSPDKAMAKTTAKFLGVVALQNALALAVLKREDPDAKVDLNPISTGFGKIHFKGMEYDLVAGAAQPFRMFAQAIANKKISARGSESEINPFSRLEGAGASVFSHIWKPTAPLSKAADMLMGKTDAQKKANRSPRWVLKEFADAIIEALTPMSVSDISSGMKKTRELGEGSLKGALIASPTLFGEGFRVKEPQEAPKPGPNPFGKPFMYSPPMPSGPKRYGR